MFPFRISLLSPLLLSTIKMNTTSKKDADNVSTIKHTSISNDSTTTQQQHEEAHSRDLVNDLQQQPLPFLVKTRTREEKESMRQQFKKQESMRKDKASTGAYDWLQRFYARFSTSFMLENKAAVARDHLGKMIFHCSSFFSPFFLTPTPKYLL